MPLFFLASFPSCQFYARNNPRPVFRITPRVSAVFHGWPLVCIFCRRQNGAQQKAKCCCDDCYGNAPSHLINPIYIAHRISSVIENIEIAMNSTTASMISRITIILQIQSSAFPRADQARQANRRVRSQASSADRAGLPAH
jgi:hypothetical protein